VLRNGTQRLIRQMIAFPRRAFLKESLAAILLLLVGPGPVAQLFLAVAASACQMECCKRAGHCLCARHSAGPNFNAVPSCASGYARSAVAPRRSDAAIWSARSSVSARLAPEPGAIFPFLPAVPAVSDPFLYQRPPPGHSS
jgi:hypothetical protein